MSEYIRRYRNPNKASQEGMTLTYQAFLSLAGYSFVISKTCPTLKRLRCTYDLG